MPNEYKQSLLRKLEERFGPLRRLAGSNSLFVVGQNDARVYLRYSKIHDQGKAFFGLRSIDLAQLDGQNSFICFFNDDDDSPPLFVPHSDFERVIRQSPLASDGQYKAQIVYEGGTRELYLPRVGRFNLDGYGGIDAFEQRIPLSEHTTPLLSHSQVQTLLGAIGHRNGFDVYVPPNNVGVLDWSLTLPFHIVEHLPSFIPSPAVFTCEIDVIWLDQSNNSISALFEVEHSTPVYSGLLRFNDLLLTSQGTSRYFVVSNEGRRELFSRQLQRPTFQRSGLSEVASFLDYSNVFAWHRRLFNT